MYIDRILLNSPIEESSYLAKLPAVKHLIKEGSLSFKNNVTFFVGENGTGKSTLIEAIAVAFGFNPEGESKNFKFSTQNSHSDLWKHLTVSKTKFPKDGYFLRAESFYNVASNIDELDRAPAGAPLIIDGYGGISLHKQSHGESFMALVQNRFFGNGLYILDEPEAALSPTRILTLIAEIDALVKDNSQFIIATHSPMLLAFPEAEILELTAEGIRPIKYQDCEHYKITRSFLDDPQRTLKYLLEQDD